MATYEYRCAEGHVTDRFRMVDERDESPRCSTCGAETARRLYPGTLVIPKPRESAGRREKIRKRLRRDGFTAGNILEPRTFAMRG